MAQQSTTKKPPAKKPTVAAILKHHGACSEAIAWAEQYGTNHAKAWKECDNPEWMLWILGKFSGKPESKSRRKLVGCCADIAELVLPNFEKQFPKDRRVRDCIAVCRKHAAGEATLEEVRSAARSAARPASAAAARSAWAAAWAAALAAESASAAWAAESAWAAARSAWAAARSAALAAESEVWSAMQRKCCDTIRQHYSKPPVVKGA